MAGKGHFELLGVWAGYVDVGFCAVVVPWLGWGDCWGDCWGWAVLVLCRDDFVYPLKIPTNGASKVLDNWVCTL
jgi:hypothetical protein